MDSVVNDLTDAQWTALQAAWAGCAYCGRSSIPLQRDCVLAISRGGRYTLENVVPACRSCNTSKCNDEVTGWLRRKRLDEQAFLRRYVELRTELGFRFLNAPGDVHAGPIDVDGPSADVSRGSVALPSVPQC